MSEGAWIVVLILAVISAESDGFFKGTVVFLLFAILAKLVS